LANDDKRIKLKPLMAVILQYLSGKSEKDNYDDIWKHN